MNKQGKSLSRVENLILGLWVGAMVGIGYIAAPVLFKLLDDRSLAGSLAGEMFRIVGLVGLFAAAVLLLGMFFREQAAAFKQWRFWVLGLMAGIIAVSMFGIQPYMVELKADGLVPGSDMAKRFGMMHGVSSILYLLNTIFGVVLLLSGLRNQGRRAKTLAELNQF